MFETSAITRYIDEALPGPSLQPADPAERAVMNQITGLLDAYAYRAMVWDIYVERCERTSPDEARIAAALPRARIVLETLATLKRDGQWLLGDQLTLADLHAAPMLGYFDQASEGAAMLAEMKGLMEWWTALKGRSSFVSSIS